MSTATIALGFTIVPIAVSSSLVTRFNGRWKLESATDCWLWTGYIDRNGYGIIATGRKHALAHRVSHTIYNGPIPDDLCVLHRCDTPSCVRPDHLWLGTRADNNADRHAKGRDGDKKGEQNGRAKLTKQRVLEIRAASGTMKEIASDYGVHKSLVSDIKTRKLWVHLK